MLVCGSVGLALLSLLACGGTEKPADVPSQTAAALAPDSDGGVADPAPVATEAKSEPAAATPPPPTGEPSEVCQKAGSAWEKRARPAIKACYREGKKSDPNLMGTARIVVDVAYDGKPKPAKLDGVSSLGDDVAKCMVDAVNKTPFPEGVECKSRQLTIPVEFPSKAK